MTKTKTDKQGMTEEETQKAVKLYNKVCDITEHGYDVEIRKIKNQLKVCKVSRKSADLELAI